MFCGLTTALVTPFDRQQKIDVSSYTKLLEHQVEHAVHQVVVCGTTGEGPTITEEEFILLVALAVERGLTVIANAGTNCTQMSVRRAHLAIEQGAQGLLVIAPYYNCPDVRGIMAHIQARCAVGLPVMFYYHPKRTGVQLGLEDLYRILSIPGVVAMKDASLEGTYTQRLREEVPHVLQLAGDDLRVLDVMQQGGNGVVSVLSNAFPGTLRTIVQLGKEGEWERGRKNLAALTPLIQALSREVNPQGIKCLLGLLQRCENVLRLPLVPVTPQVKQEIKRTMQETRRALKLLCAC